METDVIRRERLMSLAQQNIKDFPIKQVNYCVRVTILSIVCIFSITNLSLYRNSNGSYTKLWVVLLGNAIGYFIPSPKFGRNGEITPWKCFHKKVSSQVFVYVCQTVFISVLIMVGLTNLTLDQFVGGHEDSHWIWSMLIGTSIGYLMPGLSS